MDIEAFVEMLAEASVGPAVWNPYGEMDGAAALKRNNLRLYLEQMVQIKPKCLLVGEALGYRGGQLTGIPFSSEAIVKVGVGELFGEARGYRLLATGGIYQREATATMVWDVLQFWSTVPLLWNAFPFHPFRVDNMRSNRAPTWQEIEAKRPFLETLLVLFPTVDRVVAVGNKAAEALHRWEIPHHKVRHPSYGGKRDFVAGLALWQ